MLVPKDLEPPAPTGDLAGASLIRTPVRRIAVNDHPHEAMLRAIGAEDRIVAVGGHNSYDDELRRMARAADVFAGATLTVEDDRQYYGEVRYITIGFLDEAMVVLV